MTTILSFITFIGFFLAYNTSKKAKLKRSLYIEKGAQDHPKQAKVIGLGLLLLVLVGCVFYWGVTSGIFGFLILIMTVGSLVIVLGPIPMIRYKLVGVLFIISLFIELIFFGYAS